MEELTSKQQMVLDFIEQQLRDNNTPSQREIAAHFGLAQNAIYQLINYLKAKGYLVSTDGHRGIRLSDAYKQQRTGLPVVGRVAAGEPLFAEQNITDYVDINESVKKRAKNAFLLKVAGDSMVDDGIMNGDMVIVKPQPTIDDGQIGVVLLDDEATVKRVFINKEWMILKPANKKYKPKYIKRGDKNVRIVGKVIGCFRSIG